MSIPNTSMASLFSDPTWQHPDLDGDSNLSKTELGIYQQRERVFSIIYDLNHFDISTDISELLSVCIGKLDIVKNALIKIVEGEWDWDLIPKDGSEDLMDVAIPFLNQTAGELSDKLSKLKAVKDELSIIQNLIRNNAHFIRNPYIETVVDAMKKSHSMLRINMNGEDNQRCFNRVNKFLIFCDSVSIDRLTTFSATDIRQFVIDFYTKLFKVLYYPDIVDYKLKDSPLSDIEAKMHADLEKVFKGKLEIALQNVIDGDGHTPIINLMQVQLQGNLLIMKKMFETAIAFSCDSMDDQIAEKSSG